MLGVAGGEAGVSGSLLMSAAMAVPQSMPAQAPIRLSSTACSLASNWHVEHEGTHMASHVLTVSHSPIHASAHQVSAGSRM